MHVHNFDNDFIRACVYLKIINDPFINTVRKRLHLYGIHLLSGFAKGTEFSTTFGLWRVKENKECKSKEGAGNKGRKTLKMNK